MPYVSGPPGLEPVTELLFFNVTCVGMEEEVRLGQLHLNRRRLHQRHHHYHRKMLAPPYRVRLYQVTDSRTKALGSVPVPQIIRGSWHSIDITPALKELLLVPRGSNTDIMLGIRFEAPRGKTLSPKHFLRESADNSPAFLVVFSEDSSENEVTEDGLLPSPGPPVHTHAMVQKLQSTEHGDLFRGEVIDDKDNYPEIIPFSGIRRNIPNSVSSANNSSTQATFNALTVVNYTEHSTVSTPAQKSTTKKPIDLFTRHTRYMARQLPHDDIDVGKSSRVARSIVDNELPDSDTPSPDLILPKTSPGSLLLARPRSDIIPMPENSARRWRKGRKNRKRRGRKQKSWVPDDSWQNVYQVSVLRNNYFFNLISLSYT